VAQSQDPTPLWRLTSETAILAAELVEEVSAGEAVWGGRGPLERREVSELGDLRSIGSGGEGEVFFHSADPFTVFKRYHRAAAIGVLEGLLRQIDDLAVGPRSLVRSRCCLPTAVVEESGRPVGILMPVIPDQFWFVPGNGSRLLREMQHLLYEHALNQLGERGPTRPELLDLCGQWASTMSALHEAGIILGDISTKNWLWTVHPSPGVYQIDCDSYRVRNSRSVLPQKQSPDWEDPNLSPGAQATFSSDTYKLALLCIRVLLRKSTVRPRAALDELRKGDHPEAWMIPLLERVEAADRPSAKKWADSLAHESTGLAPPRQASGSHQAGTGAATGSDPNERTRPVLRPSPSTPSGTDSRDRPVIRPSTGSLASNGCGAETSRARPKLDLSSPSQPTLDPNE
jgi:hypothetical protein